MPFRDLVGHRRLLTLIARAIQAGTLPPSLLLAGPAGVGKASAALAVAQAINCLAARPVPPFARDACGECAACRRIARGVHPDVVRLEPDAMASIKIDRVRAVLESTAYRPFEGRRRVVIIDEADALEPGAQNALLKTLEEPPSGTIFLLVSARPDALLPTVLSRCPRLRFGPLAADEIAGVLARTHGYDSSTAQAVAAVANGSLRQALEAQAASVAEAQATARRVLDAVFRTRDPRGRMDATRELTGKGKPGAAEREAMAVHLRVMLSLLRDASALQAGLDRTQLANGEAAESVARWPGEDAIDAAFATVDRALAALDRNANPKLVADWLAVQL